LRQQADTEQHWTVASQSSLITSSNTKQFHTANERRDNNNKTVLRERQPPPTLKCQPKVIRDFNPNFRINADADMDVYQIAPQMLWIHSLVGVSHLAKFHKNLWATV